MSRSEVMEQNLSAYDTPESVARYGADSSLTEAERRLIALAFPPPPAFVLDVGCGAGRTSGALAELGYRVLAVDLSEPLLDRARSRYAGVEFQKMDATALRLSDGAADVVFFSYNGIDCIHPVSARLQAMREIHRVLKPGGVFLFSTHNVLGELFAGWSWARSTRLLREQRHNPRALAWYLSYPEGTGRQLLYSAPPLVTRIQLAQAGFERVRAFGTKAERAVRAIGIEEMHVHFLAQKPPP